MLDREMILKSLNQENYYVDKYSLNLFLKDWKITPVYENEDGSEFYNDTCLEKIKRGISMKAQGYDNEQIVARLEKMEIKAGYEKPEVQSVCPVSDEEAPISQERNEKRFTLDVSSQTLQMLAETIAKKLCDDITNSDIASRLIEAGGYKKDNEILAKQVKELLEHNQELSARIEQLEYKASKGFWGRFRR